MNCNNCDREKDPWEHCYNELYKSFKTSLKMAWIIAICCCIVTVVVTVKSLLVIHSFLTQWEYVEETCYEITQDNGGINTAVIVGRNEVNTYGTDYNEEKKEVRATENKLRSEKSNCKKSQ